MSLSHHQQSSIAVPTNRLRLRSGESSDFTNQQATLARLSQEVERLEAGGRNLTSNPLAISTGCSAMDACLPAGGYVAGSVIEYLRSTSGCGATYLALIAAATALHAAEDKYLVIVDTHHQLYPPALLCHQISLQRVIWVRPQSVADAVWATDQALRTTAVAAVVADLDALNERDARRLQLAAERGGGLGLLLRGLSARRMPSWAEVQWVVRSLVPMSKPSEPLRRLEVGLARVRGGKAGAKLLLDIDGARGTLDLAARQGNHHEKITAAASDPVAYQQPNQLARLDPNAGSTSQKSAVHMASQLANSTDSSRRASAG